MDWLKREWPKVVVTGLLQAIIGLIAQTVIDETVNNSDVRDIGIVLVWVAVILAGGVFLTARLVAAGFIRRGDTVTLQTGPPIPLDDGALSGGGDAQDRVEVRCVFGEENWVHLEVKNKGQPDKFVAKVTNIEPPGHTVPWSIKWRDADTEERLILKYDVALLDLATFELPAIKPTSDLANVTSGRYRLYSVSQPSGFDLPENQVDSWREELGFDPHYIKVRIAAVNQSALHVEETISFGFRPYVREDGSPGCKPDVDIRKEFYWD